MKTTHADRVNTLLQQGADYPALNNEDIAALRMLYDDDTLIFCGELVDSEAAEDANHA